MSYVVRAGCFYSLLLVCNSLLCNCSTYEDFKSPEDLAHYLYPQVFEAPEGGSERSAEHSNGPFLLDLAIWGIDMWKGKYWETRNSPPTETKDPPKSDLSLDESRVKRGANPEGPISLATLYEPGRRASDRSASGGILHRRPGFKNPVAIDRKFVVILQYIIPLFGVELPIPMPPSPYES